MNRQSNLGMMRNPEYDVYVEEKTRWQEFFYRPFFEPVVMYRIPPDEDSGKLVFHSFLDSLGDRSLFNDHWATSV